MSEKWTELLKQLAEKLGTTADHLWAVLIRQAQVSFWIDLIWYAIVSVLLIIATKLSIKFYRRAVALWMAEVDEYYFSDETGPKFTANVVSGVLCVVFLIIFGTNFFCGIEDTITKHYNPEYWALQQVSKIFKGQ